METIDFGTGIILVLVLILTIIMTYFPLVAILYFLGKMFRFMASETDKEERRAGSKPKE